MRSLHNKSTSRISFQAKEMLGNINKAIADEEKEKLEKQNKSLYEAAFTSIGGAFHKSRVKKEEAVRSIQYFDNYVTLALTEAFSFVAEKALLLDEEIYAELNPTYKTELSESIRSFLENAELNEQVNNPVVKELMEEISRNIPDAKLHLTEEEERRYFHDTVLTKPQIQTGLDSLARDTRVRVANLVANDQKELAKEQEALDKIKEKEMASAPVIPVEQEVAPEVQDEILPDVELPVEAQPEPEVAPEEETAEEPTPFVQESYKHRVIETLALNEASKMLEEGLEVNPDLALANTIKLVTVLETLDSSGLITIGRKGYENILKQSGVRIDTKKEMEELRESIKPTMTKVQKEVVRETRDGTRKFVPFSSYTKAHLTEEVNSEDAGKYKSTYGKILTEAEAFKYLEEQGFYFEFDDDENSQKRQLLTEWGFKRL